MWIIYALLHWALMAWCNYLDEYLSLNNSVHESKSIHEKIWGVLLISTLFWFLSILIFWFLIDSFFISQRGLIFSFFSAIPMVSTWAWYFYLLQLYPTNKVVPLFWISSIWLLIFELIFWASLWFFPLIWIFILVIGAYILDANTIKWKIPTQLFFYMLVVTSFWALTLFFIKQATIQDGSMVVFFYQYVGIFVLWILWLFIKPFRKGFIHRIKEQWKLFLWLSFWAEWLAQISFYFSVLAVSLAPIAAYVSAISSVQYICINILFFLFPLHERNKISLLQIFAIFIIIFWVILIELTT